MWDVREEPSVQLRGANNILLTQALFVEFGNEDAPYTLKLDDQRKNGRTYISLCKVFLSAVDEYDAAMRLVGSYKHWQRLCENKWFVDGWDQFNFEGLISLRETMRARDRSLAKAKLIQAAEQGNVTAAKILLDGGEPSTKKRQARKPRADSDSSVIDLFNKKQGAQ